MGRKHSYFVGILLGIIWFFVERLLSETEERPVKYILFWTVFQGNKNWAFEKDTSGPDALKKLGCKEINCIFTSNRSLTQIGDFDAILFDIMHKFPDHPRPRSAKQIYIAANSEPPMYSGHLMKSYNNYFNWTS
jgi:hypothetical protein